MVSDQNFNFGPKSALASASTPRAFSISRKPTQTILASYRAAAKVLGLTSRHRPGGMRENNRVENSHLVIRRRERKQQKFKSQGSAQRFLASHAAVYNTFNIQPHLISRPSLRLLRAQADRAWEAATVAA